MGKKMNNDTNALNWFEIPAKDAAKAMNFYETILDIKMFPMEMMNMKMVMFPADGSNGTVGGALVQSKMHTPSATGSIIYLNANPDLKLITDRIEKTEGKILLPKTLISKENGYMALFSDIDGNTVGLHSNE
jgi:uncharacterized protein